MNRFRDAARRFVVVFVAEARLHEHREFLVLDEALVPAMYLCSVREIRLLGEVLVLVELNAETVIRYGDVDRRQRIQSRWGSLPWVGVRVAILRSAGGSMV